jgi:hypothetical protein
MADDQEREPKPTQQTKPAKGEPVEIPVPTRSDWDKVVTRATKPVPQGGSQKHHGDPLSRPDAADPRAKEATLNRLRDASDDELGVFEGSLRDDAIDAGASEDEIRTAQKDHPEHG